jgi:hypothetical protein
MRIYTFELAHPQGLTRPAIATLAAESKQEAELLVNREFAKVLNCLLYTSDTADDYSLV